MGFNQIRLQAQRAIVAGKRLSMALEIEEGIGPARVGFGKIGLEGEGAIVAGKGLGKLIESTEAAAHIEQQLR